MPEDVWHLLESMPKLNTSRSNSNQWINFLDLFLKFKDEVAEKKFAEKYLRSLQSQQLETVEARLKHNSHK